MKCDKCDNGYTGYVVKKKNKTNSKVHEFHYYKCRSNGCNCNQRTTEVNQEFAHFLKDYTLRPQLVAPLLYYMDAAFEGAVSNLQGKPGKLGTQPKTKKPSAFAEGSVCSVGAGWTIVELLDRRFAKI